MRSVGFMLPKRTLRVDELTPPSTLGLVLPGGGARAAYQAGVLAGIAELLPPDAPVPFRVISGTSAGAINATIIATQAAHFARGARHLAAVWENMRTDLVFRTDMLTISKTLLYWSLSMLHWGFGRRNDVALLDNTPLRRLLERHVIFERVQRGIDAGMLDALCITCSSYVSARAISFYKGKPGLKPWHRTRRLGQPVDLRLDHIMASVALPVIFPAVRLGREYYGDGSLRQVAPLSPTVHLGADRILVIGVRDEKPRTSFSQGDEVPYPTLGQVAGYLLDVVFSDSIMADLERLERINMLVRELRSYCTGPQLFREIRTLLITPSEDVHEIAQRHAREFPRTVGLLLHALGGTRKSGGQLMSYLLFERGFCRELVELGKKDARAQADKLRAFLGAAPAVPTATGADRRPLEVR